MSYHESYQPPARWELEEAGLVGQEDLLKIASNVVFGDLEHEMRDFMSGFQPPTQLAKQYIEYKKKEEQSSSGFSTGEEETAEAEEETAEAEKPGGAVKKRKNEKMTSSPDDKAELKLSEEMEQLMAHESVETKRKLLEKIAQVMKLHTFERGNGTEFAESKKRQPHFVMRKLKGVAEFGKLPSFERAHPLFEQRFVKGELRVKQHLFRKTKRRAEAVLEDGSGSMCMEEKVLYTKAILYILLEGVVKGEAVVAYSKFIEEVEEWKLINTKEKALTFMKQWKMSSGGWTEVGECVEKTQYQIQQGWLVSRRNRIPLPAGLKPQVIVINDGQDSVKPIKTIAPVHALILGEENNELKNLCKDSGGTYNFFPIKWS